MSGQIKAAIELPLFVNKGFKGAGTEGESNWIRLLCLPP